MRQPRRASKRWQTKEIFLFTTYLISAFCNFYTSKLHAFCPPVWAWLPQLETTSCSFGSPLLCYVWLVLPFKHKKEQTSFQLGKACSLLLSKDWEHCLQIIKELSLMKKEAEHWSPGFRHLSSLNYLRGFGGLGVFYCFYSQKVWISCHNAYCSANEAHPIIAAWGMNCQALGEQCKFTSFYSNS